MRDAETGPLVKNDSVQWERTQREIHGADDGGKAVMETGLRFRVSFTHITRVQTGLSAMSDGLDMEQWRRKQFARRTRWLVWAESLAILGLLIWISLEYENNLFLESWAKTTIGPVSFLLNGTLAGLYAGTLLGYTVARYAGRRSEEGQILESLGKSA